MIHRTMIDKWTKEGKSEKQRVLLWNEYVPKHLLPRLYGYELMMAPYAIAHIKIGLKHSETGYRFQSEERARIYLTNALEPCMKQLQLIRLRCPRPRSSRRERNQTQPAIHRRHWKPAVLGNFIKHVRIRANVSLMPTNSWMVRL